MEGTVPQPKPQANRISLFGERKMIFWVKIVMVLRTKKAMKIAMWRIFPVLINTLLCLLFLKVFVHVLVIASSACSES